jgi:YD repeat-containing protein
VAIFNRALSSTEVQQINQAGPTGGTLPVASASFQLSTDQAGDTGPFTLSISSTGAVFQSGATVTLSETGQHSVVSTSTTVNATATGLNAAFDLNGQADGSYTVTVSNPDGSTYTVGTPLQIQPVSAPHLWAQIIGPTGVRNGIPAFFAIEYGNSGNVDATNADLLLLTNPGLSLTIHSATIALQYTGSDQTSSGTIQELVSQLSGLNVAAGSVNVIPFTVETSGSSAPIQLGSAIMPPLTLSALEGIIASYGSTTVNWASLESSVQSPSIDSTDWSLIWTRFTNEVGTTTQSLLTALSSAAAILNQIGEPTTAISSLVSYELEQASGILPNITLANTTDIADSGGGLALSVTRGYNASLLNRNNPGLFGDGWSFTYGVTAVTDASGNVYINSPSGTELFTLQSNGTYAARAGDSSTLALVGGAYVLTNASGTMERFLSDGQLSSITDSNDNVVTVSYSAGVISGVTSSNGQTLTFTTNAQGRIVSATDGHGQTVTYTYNSTGDLLLSATGPDGTTSYTYNNSGNALSENALTQIVHPDGTTANFAYDSQGYLSSESGTGGAGKVTYSYPSTGTVTGTDVAGNAITLAYDPNGNLAETTDGLGNSTHYHYNTSGELTGVVTPVGGTYTYSYDSNGNLTGHTNPDGGTVSATHASRTDLLTSFTDQNGNITDYSYDSANDLTNITYDNGSGTSYQYSPSGLLTSSTDARGQTTTFTYNAQGLLMRKTFSGGTFQAYTYNAMGEFSSAQATNGGVTAYGYNAAGKLTSVTNPSGQVESYTYNSGGQKLTRTEPDGSVTQYSYNAAGLLAEIQDGSGNLITQYSKRGKSPGSAAFFSCADSPPWTLCLMCRRHPPFPR